MRRELLLLLECDVRGTSVYLQWDKRDTENFDAIAKLHEAGMVVGEQVFGALKVTITDAGRLAVTRACAAAKVNR